MKRYHLFALLLLCMVYFIGCGKETVEVPEPLATVGETPITVTEFEKALELAKAQYSYEDLQNPKTLLFVKERVLLQLIEDHWIAKRAEQLDITISDMALAEQVQKIQEDYPKGAFEKVLLEQAISFEDWQDSIRRRLLHEAVMHHDVASEEISQEEIDAFKEKFPSNISDEIIAEELQKRKREEKYAVWREKMKTEFPVVISPEAWAKACNS